MYLGTSPAVAAERTGLVHWECASYYRHVKLAIVRLALVYYKYKAEFPRQPDFLFLPSFLQPELIPSVFLAAPFPSHRQRGWLGLVAFVAAGVPAPRGLVKDCVVFSLALPMPPAICRLAKWLGKQAAKRVALRLA